MDRPLFLCEDLWVKRTEAGGRQMVVFSGLSLSVPAEGITCLIGPSGSGKSTLLRLLNRLEDPARGRILFRGEDLRTLDPLQLRRRVALVGQSPVMLPGTVRENLEAGLRLRGRTLSEPERWLERAGLPAVYLEKDARELSGGEKQRVSLLRSLVTGPEVLLLDEVTASLDQESTGLVERLIREMNLPTIWVSHDPAQVGRVADRVFRLEGSRVREEVAVR